MSVIVILKSVSLGWPSLAYCPHWISSKFIQWFSSWNVHIDRQIWQLYMGIFLHIVQSVHNNNWFIFYGHYSPCWTLTSFTVALYWSWSCDFHLQ
jgi:hypothetical protein